jgi:hypothetical protein
VGTQQRLSIAAVKRNRLRETIFGETSDGGTFADRDRTEGAASEFCAWGRASAEAPNFPNCWLIVAMADKRAWGFRDYVKSHGFYAIYLLTPTRGWPLKVGISEDPRYRLQGLQNAHYEELTFHRFWWLPGVAMAARIEAAFKADFASSNIRGEWFRLNPNEAEAYIEAAIATLGIWSLNQQQMEWLHDRWARREYGLGPDGPSPLRGAGPRLDPPPRHGQRKRGRPSLPTLPWEDAPEDGRHEARRRR